MLTDWQGRPVLDWAKRWGVPFLEVHHQVSSTNDVLLEINEVERAPYGVVIADEQTAGRGRNNTAWYSPNGTGLLMSILLPLVSVAQPYISLIVGLAVAQTMEVLGNSVSAQIKWPNDVLLDGAFLHADDNYGMDKTFRTEMEKVFPEKKWVELPNNHEIFNNFYSLPNGLPKIHEHDDKPAKALALFHNKKIIVLYTYESDLGDGWEDINVHNNPIQLHEEALKMGTNIVIYYLTH